MKSEELENLIREKIREAEQASVPESAWDKNAAFLRVQDRLQRKQSHSRRLYLKVAAVLLLGLLSGTLLYKVELSERADFETSENYRYEKPQPLSQAPSDQLLSRGADSKQEEEEKQVLAQAPDTFKRAKERIVGRQPQRAEAVESIDVEKPQGIIIATARGAGMDTAAVAVLQLPEEAPEKVEITVVLGGKTLARMEKEEASKAVAVKNKKRQQDLNRESKEEETLPIAISRVRNPLSFNKEILP